MPSKVSNPPAGFDDLTVEEKLEYVDRFGTALRLGLKPLPNRIGTSK
jgi:hypothetical protein